MDSGDIYDLALPGGKLGVFLHGTEGAIWSNLVYECAEKENYALLFSNPDDVVTLGSFLGYDLQDRY